MARSSPAASRRTSNRCPSQTYSESESTRRASRASGILAEPLTVGPWPEAQQPVCRLARVVEDVRGHLKVERGEGAQRVAARGLLVGRPDQPRGAEGGAPAQELGRLAPAEICALEVPMPARADGRSHRPQREAGGGGEIGGGCAWKAPDRIEPEGQVAGEGRADVPGRVSVARVLPVDEADRNVGVAGNQQDVRPLDVVVGQRPEPPAGPEVVEAGSERRVALEDLTRLRVAGVSSRSDSTRGRWTSSAQGAWPGAWRCARRRVPR